MAKPWKSRYATRLKTLNVLIENDKKRLQAHVEEADYLRKQLREIIAEYKNFIKDDE